MFLKLPRGCSNLILDLQICVSKHCSKRRNLWEITNTDWWDFSKSSTCTDMKWEAELPTSVLPANTGRRKQADWTSQHTRKDQQQTVAQHFHSSDKTSTHSKNPLGEPPQWPLSSVLSIVGSANQIHRRPPDELRLYFSPPDMVKAQGPGALNHNDGWRRRASRLCPQPTDLHYKWTKIHNCWSFTYCNYVTDT